MSGVCNATCDDTTMMSDEINMECNCMDTDQYYKHEFDEITNEYVGGACVDIPECTAGTTWHPHWAKCEYREPCSDREHFDEE